jgi:ubiquinone/menaquinone biosynthesis C-methylase UbiE
MTAAQDDSSDIWTQWLLHRRHGNDAEFATRLDDQLHRIRDRVLDAAGLGPGMTLADVGSGEGLIAFGAVARVGPSLRVIITDASVPLLRRCEDYALARGIASRCTFVHATADHLEEVQDGSADVVTCRAVLAYVADKKGAFSEFHRLLKPGGRLSIAEPILRDQALEAHAMAKSFSDTSETSWSPILDLLHRWKAAQFPATEEALRSDPLVNYTERDLVAWARAAGFAHVHLEFHLDVQPASETSWSLFLAVAPHPWAPTLGEILRDQFSELERRRFEEVVRPLIESGRWVSTSLIAYLVATK